MLTTIIIIAGIAQILVSLFVLLRGRGNLTNLLFFFLGIATLAWAIANYLTVIFLDSPNLIAIVRLILFCVVIQNAFFYLFVRTFPARSWKHSKKGLMLYGIGTFLAAGATLSPYVFTSVYIKNGLPITEAGPAILVFIAHAAFSISFAFKTLIKSIRSTKGVQKTQLQILLLASFLNWVIVPITNFAITPLFKTTFFIVYGPIYTLLFASIIAYAIVSQKLFDIRAAVARSVGYLLSLGFIGAVYGLIIYIFSSFFLPTNTDANLQRAVYIGFALISAVSYPSIKIRFDKLTNRLFYRDAYEPQVFLDELNTALVRNIELEVLLRETSTIIQQHIKPEYCMVAVRQDGSNKFKIIGTREADFTEGSFDRIRSGMHHLKVDILVADELGAWKLQHLLTDNNIAVITALRSGLVGQEPIAYLILGSKKSGNIYNAQDIRIINIISDELVIAIQNALRFEEIQGFAATLQAKVNEATTKLKHTNEKLKALDETKDEFISMASHQLRTPLTSVKGYLSMVLEGDAGKVTDEQSKLLEQAYASSQRMVYLIADLLNVSRLKTGKFVIDAKPTNLADMVESEIAQLKEQAKLKNLKLIYHKPTDFPQVMLDETKIRQVIMNFVDNAIYYTPSGGVIKLELNNHHGNIYFRVIDNGLGVPKEEQSHMLTKFYRAQNARKARPDGTGLGLFMAKKVISAQGGTLLFESIEGKGSTFGFAFQKSKLIKPNSRK